MREPKMTRVDITLNVSDKGGRIKKGKYTYTIASQDFPKGSRQSDQRIGRSRRNYRTPPCHAVPDSWPSENTQTILAYHPHNLPVPGKWAARTLQCGKKTDGKEMEIRN